MAWVRHRKIYQNLIILNFFYSLLFLLSWSENAVTFPLDWNGGYDVVVAMRPGDGTVNETIYVENIKLSFQSLSRDLWLATDGRFFINSLEIVIPTDWTSLTLTQTDLSMKNYGTADIRISSNFKYPHVKNPTSCLGGDHVNLPIKFFLFPITGEFGDNSKTLLVLWARYRWGVWEEYGYPGDENFPYFYKNVSNIEPPQAPYWFTTGCPGVDEERGSGQVVGNYGNLNTTSPNDCNPLMDSEMESSCRFFPNATANNVTTSLMHFHWLPSVRKFCDASTHNRAAPNRQNYFCNYQSAMETIDESIDDMQAYGETVLDPTIKSIKVVKPFEKPLLYVLMDHGRLNQYFNQTPPGPLVQKVRESLETLLVTRLDRDILTSVGYYPLNNTSGNIKELIHWQILGGHESDVQWSLETATQFDETVYSRQFDWSIKQATMDIVTHPNGQVNGGVIILFKTTTEVGGWTSSYYTAHEKDLEDLMVGGKIRFFSIEIVQSITGGLWTGNTNYLAERTGGLNLELGKLGADEEEEMLELDNLIQKIVDIYSPMKPEPVQKRATSPPETIIWRGRPIPFDPIKIPLLPSAGGVTVYFYTIKNLNESTDLSGQVEGIVVGEGKLEFIKTPRWTNQLVPDLVGTGRGFLFKAELDLVIGGGKDSEKMNDPKTLIFTHNHNESYAHYLIVTLWGDQLPEAYDISVTTTARNGQVNYGQTPDLYTPFAVYAEITQGGHPVLGLDVQYFSINADANGGIDSNRQLTDDGSGYPDLVANDGIYSSLSFPDDKTVRYWIQVRSPPSPMTTKISQTNSSFIGTETRPLPLDQVDLTQGLCHPNDNDCGPVGPVESCHYEIFLPLITFENFRFLKLDYPYPIRDLVVSKDERGNGGESWDGWIFLNMTAPRIFDRYVAALYAPTWYRVYSSPSHDSLTKIRLGQLQLPSDVHLAHEHIDLNDDPGVPVVMNFEASWNASFMYFTVISYSQEFYNITIKRYSPPSNVVGIRGPPIPPAGGEDGENTSPWIRSVGGVATIVGVVVLIIIIFSLVGTLYYRAKRGNQIKAEKKERRRRKSEAV